MADGVVDRQEWALVVQELLDAEGGERAHGAKTRFAAKVGVNVRTVGHWLGQGRGVDVSEANVRKTAKAYGLNEMELLIRVGVYTLDQLPPRPTHEQFDAERRAVLDDPHLDNQQKKFILEQLDEMEAADERLIEQQRERDKKRRAAALATLLEQQRAKRTA